MAGTLAEIREQRDGPTAEERAHILTALNTHFKDREPTLELVLPYASTDAARQAACRVAVRAAVNQWRGAAADGERTPAQRRWRQHAGWANERSLDEGADKAVAGLVANADANQLFAPGARPTLARPAWARPRDAALEGAVLQEARELGATWDTGTYRNDVAVISVKEAFIEAYFAPLTDSALPEGVKTADAIAHLEHESCYGRRARVGPTEVCGLCKRHSTFCSRLEQLADAGAAATSPPAPPGYHFFRLEVAKPALFCWCEPPPISSLPYPIKASAGWPFPQTYPHLLTFFYHSDARGLELLKAGAAACEQSDHTALKSVRAKRSLEPRPSCCDVRTKIRLLRGKGHTRCQTCLLTLPDEEQPGFSETVARLEKQPRIG